MAAEGGETETQQKDETKRHTYPLVRVSRVYFPFMTVYKNELSCLLVKRYE
jgi:hypothetical protein